MTTEMKQIEISITPSMEADLIAAKKENYCQETQNDMIRDLIIRGLMSIKVEQPKKIKRC